MRLASRSVVPGTGNKEARVAADPEPAPPATYRVEIAPLLSNPVELTGPKPKAVPYRSGDEWRALGLEGAKESSESLRLREKLEVPGREVHSQTTPGVRLSLELMAAYAVMGSERRSVTIQGSSRYLRGAGLTPSGSQTYVTEEGVVAKFYSAPVGVRVRLAPRAFATARPGKPPCPAVD
jgi:hypothetical protein